MTASFAFAVFLVQRSAESLSLWAGLFLFAGLGAGGVLVWWMFRRSDSDEQDGGSGGGGGLRRGQDKPRTPPPAGPVCWPEFERQFAEYVAHSKQHTAARDDAGPGSDRSPSLP
jgi:hypothetical protein